MNVGAVLSELDFTVLPKFLYLMFVCYVVGKMLVLCVYTFRKVVLERQGEKKLRMGENLPYATRIRNIDLLFFVVIITSVILDMVMGEHIR